MKRIGCPYDRRPKGRRERCALVLAALLTLSSAWAQQGPAADDHQKTTKDLQQIEESRRGLEQWRKRIDQRRRQAEEDWLGASKAFSTCKSNTVRVRRAADVNAIEDARKAAEAVRRKSQATISELEQERQALEERRRNGGDLRSYIEDMRRNQELTRAQLRTINDYAHGFIDASKKLQEIVMSCSPTHENILKQKFAELIGLLNPSNPSSRNT